MSPSALASVPSPSDLPSAGAALAAENLALREELEASRLRYRRLMGATPDGIYVLDAEGVFLEINCAGERILARRACEVVGRHFAEFVVPDDLPIAADAFRRVLEREEDWDTVDLRVVRPTGEQRMLQICRAPLIEDEHLVGMIGIARDTTEQRAREMQLRRAERMASVGPLLSSVCHELNNPLTSIRSFAELMLLDERPPEDREALEIVEREASRAAKIVSDLRVVARQAREAGSGRGLVELNPLVERVADRRRAARADSRIELRLHLAPGLPAAWIVEPLIEQVVDQLLLNAEQALAGHDGPRTITVRTHPGAVGVALLVHDSGPGIADEHIDRIFDPFWTTRLAGEGTGLGLSIVQGIVADLGGVIRVDGNPGRGAAFTVDLPVADQAPVALGETESESEAARPLRLLVVDDEAPIRFSLQRYMERRGHQVEQAAEGEAALALLAAATVVPAFDVILADLRMPGLDGERLLERLRDRHDGLDERLIFITGDQDSPDAARFLADAAVPVVQKPFELAEIAQIIEAHAGMINS